MRTPVKINLGSGTTASEDWINIDKSWNICLSRVPIIKKMSYKLNLISEDIYRANWQKGHVIRRDITKKLPFKDGTVDFVYCSHVIEHLTYPEARRTCKEVYRVLKHNGVFRVVVPDLNLLARKYLDGDREFFGAGVRSRAPISNLFLRSLNLAGLRKRSLLERFSYSEHKWMYDFESLALLLKLAGFRLVHESQFREGLCPDLKEIEMRTKSIYVDALK